MLNPRDGILWAHPTLNAKGLTEVSPFAYKRGSAGAIVELNAV